MTVPPGWYPDPAEPTTQRYWDGEGWIGSPLPVDVTPPPGPPAEPAPAPAAPAAPAGGPVSPAGPPGPPPGAGYPPVPPPGAGHPPGAPPGWGQPPFPPPGHPAAAPPLPRPHGLPLAGYGARLLARLIDFAVLLVLNIVVNGFFVWRLLQEFAPAWREAMRRAESGVTSTEPLPQPSEQASTLWVVILLIATALWFAYEVPALANRGQTLGKRLLGIRVVALADDPGLTFGQSFRRWNTLGLPTLLWYCCGLGLLLQFVDALSPLFDQPLRQALHDKRAATVVVQVTPAAARTTPDRPNPPGETS